jgi:hypothetical protein
MTTEEALNLIAETNEPLYTVLKELMERTERIDHSQAQVIEALIFHIMNPNGPATIDLSEVLKALQQYKSN